MNPLIKFLFSSLIVFVTQGLSAKSALDDQLLEYGVVDATYRIIDYKTFDEIFRISTNKVTPMLPMKIDSSTTVLSMLINRFGFYTTYQIDDIETKGQATALMNSGVFEFYKNYMCSLEYSQSSTFKVNRMNINFTLVNSEHRIIYLNRFPFSDC